ncbi:sigma factor-like helix-turn-helix DNA-binding protein [Sphingomonas sp. H39-1-10]|uniref:sigma factor-like helix-turn-helix DNA-binding protein n=1 Tax=Sphingomonas pollutisoli TaxID=3030829 RepID=UPI0023B9EF5A|nr:sigma factor-like helix-turn-helix DNA-binding protein [Sphingomonas pollutisoli]MDF0491173.1 sigma factor-like helix-turn-helix DNA-binding protein [Sphingomonas pollutisoli]
MIDQPILQLLRDCRRLLRGPGLRFMQNRATVQRISSYLAAERATLKFGGSVIAHARANANTIRGVSVDPCEDEVRPHPGGIQVKAWILVPHEVIALLHTTDPSIEVAFARLDRQTREVLILSARHGLSVEAIGTRMRISRRRVRDHLRRGVEAISHAIVPASE